MDKEALKQESLRETLCTEGLDGWRFSSGAMTLFVPRQGKELFRDLTIGGELRAADACLKAILERRGGTEGSYVRTEWPGVSMIQEAVLEDAGPLMWSFCFRGTHVFQGIKDSGMKDFMERGSFPETGKEAIPFILRMKLYRDTTRIDEHATRRKSHMAELPDIIKRIVECTHEKDAQKILEQFTTISDTSNHH